MPILAAIILIICPLLTGCGGAPPAEKKEEPPAKREVLKQEREYRPRLPVRRIIIGAETLSVEVADEPAERSRGLMYREYLPDSAGMLFIFDREAPHSFWMRNTLIPLSIAFVDAGSTITDIRWMKPLDESHCLPSGPVRFAIEANRGWFSRRGIKPGTRVNLNPGEED